LASVLTQNAGKPPNGDIAVGVAAGIFYLALSGVVLWLVVRIGRDLPRRWVFHAIACLLMGSGAAQFSRIAAMEYGYAGVMSAGRIFQELALPVLSILIFISTPQLLIVLRGINDVSRRRGQERFHAVIQAAPMAVVSADGNGRVTSWNPSAERIFRWKEEEILGTRVRSVPREKVEEQFALFARTLKGEITTGFESVRINRAGQRFPVSISSAPLYDEQGKLTGIMAAIEDISERKRVERELHEKTVTLAAVTHALNSFLESGDWSGASKHLLKFAIEQTQSEYGFLGAVLEGPVLRVLAHSGIEWDAKENHELWERKLRQHAEEGYFEVSHLDNLLSEVIVKGKTVISNVTGKDHRSGGVPGGHPVLQSFLGVPIFKGAELVGFIGVANRAGGYTGEELRSLETMSQATGVLYDNYRQSMKRAQLEEHRERLESDFRHSQKMEVLGQLAGGVAHDFNNMLMVLTGSAELLEQTLAAGSPASPYVEQIRRTTEKAAGITKQLLAFSRKQLLEVCTIDLHEVLTDCEFMLPRLLGSDIELTFSPGAKSS
jgi:two-component system, cell cycle sensor histidine kinase and response regulator CckA